MDYQKIIFDKMVFGPLASNMSGILYPYRNPEDLFYAEYAYKIQEPNLIFPERRETRFEHDVILMLERYGERSGRKKILQKDIISIEIKSTIGDNIDSDVEKYIGATRLFFIAAPAAILPAVICRYHDNRKKSFIGMIDSDAGQVVVFPQFQNFQKDRQNRLLARCYTSVHRLPTHNDTEPFSLFRVPEIPTKAIKWTEFDGARVNDDYLDLFREQRDANYSLKQFYCSVNEA